MLCSFLLSWTKEQLTHGMCFIFFRNDRLALVPAICTLEAMYGVAAMLQKQGFERWLLVPAEYV